MRICIIGPANSAHIVKWCDRFSARGHEMHVISFVPGEIDDTTVHLIDLGVDADGSDAGKLKYLFTGGKIRRLINRIKPDVVTVHYATSYGAAVALSGVSGYILSVWGSDIYDFPKKSPMHKALLKFSLRRPTLLLSTSRAMADEASQYTKRPFVITPFGVDTELFRPDISAGASSEDVPGVTETEGNLTDVAAASYKEFTIGTVKALSDKYGIRDILKAASILRDKHSVPVRLRIAGKGPQEEEYRQLAIDLGIDDITEWLGFISQEDAAKEWAEMDVAVIPSTLDSESFGVSAVEAEACGTPVIISDVGGLMESTVSVPYDSDFTGKTFSAISVPRQDPEAITTTLLKLYEDPKLRQRMGETGRKNVKKKYDINTCFLRIERILKRVSENNGD